jgi:hypothetical protein
MQAIMSRTWEYDRETRPQMQELCDELQGVKDSYPYDSEVC